MANILTENQQKIIELVVKNKNIQPNFYLTGGTALAEYYFQHRVSDDLDFFSEQPFSLMVLEPLITNIINTLNATEVKYNKLFDRHIYFFKVGNEEIKIEFTYFENKRINPTKVFSGLQVDDLLDIGANKIMAMLDRNEPKDFIDLYFILHQINLDELLKVVKKKYQVEIDPITLGSAFNKGVKIEFPKEKLFKNTVPEIRSFWDNKTLEFKPKIFE